MTHALEDNQREKKLTCFFYDSTYLIHVYFRNTVAKNNGSIIMQNFDLFILSKSMNHYFANLKRSEFHFILIFYQDNKFQKCLITKLLNCDKERP